MSEGGLGLRGEEVVREPAIVACARVRARSDSFSSRRRATISASRTAPRAGAPPRRRHCRKDRNSIAPPAAGPVANRATSLPTPSPIVGHCLARQLVVITPKWPTPSRPVRDVMNRSLDVRTTTQLPSYRAHVRRDGLPRTKLTGYRQPSR